MERLQISEASVAECVAALRPSAEDTEQVRGTVADVVEMVRAGGDEAIRRLTTRLDHADVTDPRVPQEALDAALAEVDPEVREAIDMLIVNLRRTAAATMPAATREVLPQGQVVSTRPVPVERVGIYVPGGLAAYPSSLVMAVVPAQVAGVPAIAVSSPPAANGRPDRTVLAACAILGVREVYAIGGAQAVAALAIGTETIPAVDVLVGPGNAYVEEAKRRLFGEVGIESLAGPSELVVLADRSAAAAVLAWDLRAQAEHGAGARSVLVSDDERVLEAVAAELGAGTDGVVLAHATSWDAALAFVNAYAPEHVQLAVREPEDMLGRIRHAGAIFVGEMSGTAYGDYIAGSNHILPTGGRGRFSSGLGPSVFLRTQEVIEIPAEAAVALARPLAALARAEGLDAHARSAEVRAELVAERAQIEQGAAT